MPRPQSKLVPQPRASTVFGTEHRWNPPGVLRMRRDATLPLLSRVDFYRLHEGELIAALALAIAQHVERFPDGSLIAAHEAILAWAKLSVDVPNGGFTQFFYNHRGDDGVEELT